MPRGSGGQRPVKVTCPLPRSHAGWLDEIARAYNDASGRSTPHGVLVAEAFRPEDLFHLGPVVCLKFRGVRRTKGALKRATDAALMSYVASEDDCAVALQRPHLAFAFCYLASHFGLDLLTAAEVQEIMDYVGDHEARLLESIE